MNLDELESALSYDGYTYLRTEDTGSTWGPYHYFEVTCSNNSVYDLNLSVQAFSGVGVFGGILPSGTSSSFEVRVSDMFLAIVEMAFTYSLRSTGTAGSVWQSPSSSLLIATAFEIPVSE